jgi:hypothetical protein
MDITNQARENRERENREYVRKLLRDRQPDFAVALESVVQEPCCPASGGHIRDDLAGTRLSGDQVAVDHRHPAWHGGAGIARCLS